MQFIVRPCSGLHTRTFSSSQTGTSHTCYLNYLLVPSHLHDIELTLAENRMNYILSFLRKISSFGDGLSYSYFKLQGSSGTENKRDIQRNNRKQLEDTG